MCVIGWKRETHGRESGGVGTVKIDRAGRVVVHLLTENSPTLYIVWTDLGSAFGCWDGACERLVCALY